MSVKYTIPFKNIANQQCRVDIDILSYVGDPITLRGTGRGNTFTLIWQPDEETMSHVLIASNATLNVYQQDGNIDVEELQLLGDRDALMLYYEGDVLKWKGFVVSDGLQQPFNGAVESVTIQATDGLKLLEGVNTTSPNTTATGTPNRAPINYFRDLLWNRLGNELPIRFVLNSLECTAYPDTNVMAGSVQWSPRGQGYSDDAGNVRSAYWTLFGMTDSFFARIYQSDGYWVVERKTDIITGEYEAKEVEDITITDVSVNVNKTIGKTGDYPFIREDAFLMTKAAIKKVETTYNHSQNENIIPNGNFSQTLLGSALYWSSSLPDGECIVNRLVSMDGRADNGSIEVGLPSGSSSEEEYMTAYDIEEGIPVDMHTLYNKIELQFDFMPITGFSYYSTSGIDGNGVYRDQGEIDWSDNPMRIMVLTYIPSGSNIIPYVLNEYGYWVPLPTGGTFNRYNYTGYAESPSVFVIDNYFSGSPIIGDYINRVNDGTEIARAYVRRQDVNNLVSYLNYAGQYLVDNTDATGYEVIADGTTGQILRIRRPNSGTNIGMSWGLSSSLRDGTISITVDKMKIGDVAQINIQGGNQIKIPDPIDLTFGHSDDRVGKLYYRLYVRRGQNIRFANVTATVNDNQDVYSAEVIGGVSVNNTAIETRILNISSAFSGFYKTNYMTSFSENNNEFLFSNGTDEGSLTRLHAIDTLRTRSKAAKVFTGSINVRSGGWKFGEVYTIPTLDGKKFISLGATWKCEDCEVQLTALEAFYDTELMLDVKHYGSETEPINI